MTVQEQSLLIPSYHITATLDIPFSVLTLLGFVRVMENGQELLPSVRKVLFTYAMCSMHGIICIMYVLSCQTIVHVLYLLRMVALPLVLDQPWLEHTSTTTVIVGINELGISVECVKLVRYGREILLHVLKVSQFLISRCKSSTS